MSIRQWKAAISQAEPCWFDKASGIAKSVKLIQEAQRNGASLIAFSETWVPGYPVFLWSGTYRENMPLVRKYMVNSINAYGEEILEIRKAAADNGIYVCFGFSERAGSTLYISQMLIGPDGRILLHRRKLKPTHLERTLFGDATGDSLTTVVDTELGKIGMLNCWEHFQPLLKYHTYAQGEQVHIAAWPFTGNYTGGPEPWSLCSEAGEGTASRMYSLEGCSYVLCTNQPISPNGIRLNSEGQAEVRASLITAGGGRAAVFGPDGKQLTRPTDPTWDGLIYCDIDLDSIYDAKALTDCVGHYSRPDLLRLLVDEQPKNAVVRAPPVRSDILNGATTSCDSLLAQHVSLEEIMSKERDRREKEMSGSSVEVIVAESF